MKTVTDQALHTFDVFVSEWVPHAMHEYMFGHATNAADSVRRAIQGIHNQELLPLRPEPFGYAVFRQEVVQRNRDYRQGVMYLPASPVFENPAQGENSLDGFRQRRKGFHVLGEITEWRRG